MTPKPKLQAELVYITPKIAADYLTHNTHNRTMKRNAVARYANLMERGLFYATHQGIGFNGDGQLLDGQNRLQACIEADTGFWALVVRGLEREVQGAVDNGVRRTPKDRLELALNVATSNNFVAVLRIVVGDRGRGSDDPETIAKGYTRFHTEIEDVMNMAYSSPHAGIHRAAVIGAVARALIARPERRKRLGEFLDVLGTGEAAKKGDETAVHLRNFLLALTVRGKGLGGGTGSRYLYRVAQVVIKAFLDAKVIPTEKAEQFLAPSEDDLFQLPR